MCNKGANHKFYRLQNPKPPKIKQDEDATFYGSLYYFFFYCCLLPWKLLLWGIQSWVLHSTMHWSTFYSSWSIGYSWKAVWKSQISFDTHTICTHDNSKRWSFWRNSKLQVIIILKVFKCVCNLKSVMFPLKKPKINLIEVKLKKKEDGSQLGIVQEMKFLKRNL